jgi:hypothetical protein
LAAFPEKTQKKNFNKHVQLAHANPTLTRTRTIRRTKPPPADRNKARKYIKDQFCGDRADPNTGVEFRHGVRHRETV